MVSTHVFLSTFHLLLIFFLSLLITASYLQLIEPVSCTKSPVSRCSEVEREALIGFKDNLTDPSGRLSSWVGDDCCNWTGVDCDNSTGNVIQLDLINPSPLSDSEYFFNGKKIEVYCNSCLGGKISPSLLNLKHLNYLDLSLNNFSGNDIPKFLGSIESLKYLNLSLSLFAGFVPPHLGNLTNLRRLDLGMNNLIGKIPSSFANLCSLQILDLHSNNISGEITEFVDGLSQCSNSILEFLDLSRNKLLGGNLPCSIGNLSSLQVLDLSSNQVTGTIPESIEKLSKLVVLSLFENSWEGALSETHFQNLTHLESLDLSTKYPAKGTLVLNVKQDWVPPFKLTDIILANVRIGPNFPAWLKTQNELNFVVLHNVGISDTIPEGLWKSCSYVVAWILSGNKLRGQVPYFQFPPLVEYFDLSSNNLEGPLPLFRSNLIRIYLENNNFSGSIPENIGKLLPQLNLLDISSNSITGRIPHSIGMLKELIVLTLRNNSLSGKLPSHWKNLRSLLVLDLTQNNISGNVPSSMRHLSSLLRLSLHQNHLEGELPSFFKNYRNLQSLDLGRNKFSGKVPSWIGESLPSLLRLSLRSNLFHGDIPQQLCLLSRLRILDLAHNDFSGAIPQCLGNLSTYDDEKSSDNIWSYNMQLLNDIVIHNTLLSSRSNNNQLSLVSKGREYLYDESILNLIHYLDLSSNNLSGEIPDNITNISKLVIMNLSMNHLTGRIPKQIGNLHMLESLDLSMNDLYGPIPESLSSLNFLSYLNMSFNNLSGKIPNGNQLRTLDDSSIYEGNSLLCGLPLSTKCSEDETRPRETPNGGNRVANKNGMEIIESLSFYISMACGFIVGFWGVCGTLIIKTSWRQAYFRSFDDLKDKIVVFIMVEIVRFLRKVKWERS